MFTGFAGVPQVDELSFDTLIERFRLASRDSGESVMAARIASYEAASMMASAATSAAIHGSPFQRTSYFAASYQQTS